jgi:CelD/BcsL family acetyltransferase involved in cellulose biosynthesis
MRYAIERKCDAFDFTIGDERYKSEWCDGVFKLYDHVSAATWRGACRRR